jgi:hypothetical protein
MYRLKYPCRFYYSNYVKTSSRKFDNPVNLMNRKPNSEEIYSKQSLYRDKEGFAENFNNMIKRTISAYESNEVKEKSSKFKKVK